MYICTRTSMIHTIDSILPILRRRELSFVIVVAVPSLKSS